MRRRGLGRYFWLGVGIAVAVLAMGTGTWFAVGGSLCQRLSHRHMTVVAPEGPVVVCEKPVQRAQAAQWREMSVTPLKVSGIHPGYTRDDGTRGKMAFRLAEDEEGHRWLAPMPGCNPPIPSPDRSLYFFEDGGQLYLLDSETLEVAPLTPWDYQGKSRPELVEERGSPVFWVGWPLWAPDGCSIVYTTDRSGEFELRQLDVATRTESVITSCAGRNWLLHSWTNDGRLLVQDYVGGSSPDAFFLLDRETGAREPLPLVVYLSCVEGPNIIAHQSPNLASSLVFYDVNRRRTAALPAAPQGYFYQMPFIPSPDGARMAFRLGTNSPEHRIGVIEVAADPPTLRTFQLPALTTDDVIWLDDETLMVRSGDMNDPERVTYALTVGGAE